MLESPATDRGRTAEEEAAVLLAQSEDDRRVLEVKVSWSEARARILQEHVDWLRTKANAAEGEAAQLRVRLHEAEKALRPFAKAGELFGPREPDSYDQAVYMPAAGPEYGISGDDLRRARSALTPAPEANQEAGDA